MDGEANPQVPPPPPPSNAASTSTSTSSPALLRHVKAAFKRHRSLGMMQTNNIRPKRVVLRVPQHEGAKKHDNIDPLSQRQNVNISDFQDVVSVVKKSQEVVSISPPSISGTTFEENLKPFAVQHNRSKCVVADKDSRPMLPCYVECEQVKGADGKMAKGLENLSSHMGSLALIETERDASNQAESLVAVNFEAKYQNKEVDSNLRSDAAISALAKGPTSAEDQLHQLGNFLSQPATQPSVVGFLGCTTTSVRSTSAPMLSSTTCCHSQTASSFQVAGESLGRIIMDSLHIGQESKQQPVQISPKHRSGLLGDQRASTSQPSDVIHARFEEHHNPSKSECDSPKEIDIPRNPSNVYSKLAHERGLVMNAVDAESQDPLPKNHSDAKLMPKQEKEEKVATSKGTSGSHKRNYDPDLFYKVNGKLYQRLGKIGSGGSSEVHKVISSDCKIYALKKIKLKGRDYATAYGFCQEIEYLNRLKGKNNIIQLIDYEVTDKSLLNEVMNGTMSNKDGRVRDDGYIYMVLEYGEVDLAHMLSQKWKEMDGSQTIDDNWLRFYWQQILQAVNTIHEERIVHSDLKPANFLLVKGYLKLIDFGIAKAIMSDTTNIQRDSQVGTLSYMSPEAFLCNENDANGNPIKCGRPSDIWSLGCILYQMVYGSTPFSEYKTFWAKFKVITDPNHEISYEPVSNPWLFDLMKKCLAWDRNKRWRIPQLLQHPFLVPPHPSHQPTLGSRLLQLIAEGTSDDDQESSVLCSELQKLLNQPFSPSTSESLLSIDQQCKLLHRISNLAFQLQVRLQKSDKG